MKNIYAHTGPTPKEGYVGYISVNQRESGIEVSVRSEGNPAPLGVITLSPEQCEHLATDLLAHINQEPPAKPDQQAQAGCDYCNNPMFAGFKCDNCGRKPEQQAQSGEPEVEEVPKGWIPVGERMPKSGQIVLALQRWDRSEKLSVIRAAWSAPKTEEASPESDHAEYDEATDTYYEPEGWYEQMSHWDDYAAVFVSGATIVAWMPLPAAMLSAG